MLYAIRLPLRNDFTEQHKKLRSIQGKTKRLHRELILQLPKERADIFPTKAQKEILFSLAKIPTPQAERLAPDRDPFLQKPRTTKTLPWLRRSPGAPSTSARAALKSCSRRARAGARGRPHRDRRRWKRPLPAWPPGITKHSQALELGQKASGEACSETLCIDRFVPIDVKNIKPNASGELVNLASRQRAPTGSSSGVSLLPPSADGSPR